MAHLLAIRTLCPQLNFEATKTPPSPTTESSLSFASASDIPNESFVDIENPVDSASMVTTIPLLSAMETPPLTNHSKYYMQDGMVKFKVEYMLYRVPAYAFVRNSNFFHTIIPGSVDPEHPSISYEPIDLSGDDVKSVDFERLLSILFPPVIGQYAAATCDEWTSILHLASKWGFVDVRDLAIREAFPLASAMDRIVLGRRYDLEDWLLDAFVSVCERPVPLTLAEASRLSLEDVVLIGEAREAIRRPTTLVDADTVQTTISRLFSVAGLVTRSACQGACATPTCCILEGLQNAGPIEPHPVAHAGIVSAAPSIVSRADLLYSASQPKIASLVGEPALPLVMDNSLVQIANLFPDFTIALNNPRRSYDVRDLSIPTEDIIMLLENSDKKAITLRRFVELTVGEGIKWSGHPRWSVAIALADLCKSLPGRISNDFQITVDGQLLSGGDLAVRYIREQCNTFIDDWDKPSADAVATTADSILSRQRLVATFVGYLHDRSLLSGEVLALWSEKLVRLPVKPTLAAVRSLCELLRLMGKALDTPQTEEQVDAVFFRLSLLRLDWTYSVMHSTIAQLAALRIRGWK